MGDGNLVGTEHCALSDIKAIATHVVGSDEQPHDFYTPWRMFGVRLWKQAQEMGDFTVEALADQLCEEYDVAPDEARQDVADIIAEWQKVDVVE